MIAINSTLPDEKTAAVAEYVEAVKAIGQPRYGRNSAEAAAAIIAVAANIAAGNRHIMPQHLRGAYAAKYLLRAEKLSPLSAFPAFSAALEVARVGYDKGHEASIYGIVRYALGLEGKEYLIEDMRYKTKPLLWMRDAVPAEV